MTLNVPQVIALYALGMKFGRDAEFTVLDRRVISGDVLVEVKSVLGTKQYYLPLSGGSEPVEFDPPKEVPA